MSYGTSTKDILIVGGTSTGDIIQYESGTERDWFKIFLYAGQQVQFDAKGSATYSGNLANPGFQLYKSDGLSSPAYDSDSGVGLNAMLVYTATVSGYYYAEVFRQVENGGSYSGGTYSLSATPLSFIKTSTATINQNTVYVADGTNGLQIKTIGNPDNSLVYTGSYNTTGEATDVAIVGKIAYVADGSAGLQIINISNPSVPTLLASFDTAGTALGVAISIDNYAYIADGYNGLKIVDIYTPSNPIAGGSYDTTGIAYDVATRANYVYVADGASGLQIIDVTNPLLPVRLGGYDTTGMALSVSLSGNYAYIADGESGLQIIDISNPTSPARVGGYSTTSAIFDVIIKNTTAYIANGARGIQVLDISNPIDPVFIKTLATNGEATNVVVGKDYAYVNSATGMQAVRFTTNSLPTGNVTISGNIVQGQTLIAHNTLADADGLGVITYSWIFRTTVVIGNTYSLTAADVGKSFFVKATYTDGAGVAETLSSAVTAIVTATGVVNHTPTGLPSISDTTPTVGQILTANKNTLADADVLGVITYTWKTGTTVLGTGTTHTVTSAELGKTLSVTASYTDALGKAESVNSAITSAVIANHAPVGTVSINGRVMQGQSLTVSGALTDADGIIGAVSYKWFANGFPIAGATNSYYTLTSNEVGKAMSVSANYTDGLGKAESVSSPETNAVTPLTTNHAPTGSLTINDNTPQQGQVLSASNTLVDADVIKTAITYTWKTGTTVLGTGTTHTVTAAEVGKTLAVTASYTDGLGKAESVSSAITSAVTATATAGFTITPAGTQNTGENGTSVNYSFKLNSAPTAGQDVSLTFVSSDTSEGVISSANKLTFSSTNWTVPQTLSVRGVDDYDYVTDGTNGTVSYSVSITVSTIDVFYKNLVLSPLTLNNLDDGRDKPLDFYGDQGGSKIDTVTGLDGNDKIRGLNMDDDLHGGIGNDTLWGGTGDDNLFGDAGNDYLWGEQENDYIDGGIGNDTLDGSDGNDTLLGGDGNDNLDGGKGVDSMSGGNGNDTYYLNYDVEDLAINDGGLSTDIDTVIMPYQKTSYTLPASIENGTIAAGTQPSNLTGNASNNTLTGNDGNNSLDGGLANDMLNGGLGNDSLNGGTGTDTASYSTITAGVTVNLGLTTAQNTGGAGTDLLAGIENVIGGNGADKLTGDANANTLTGDLGRDSLFGGLGNDVLTGGVDNDTIDGGTGVDTASYSTATAGVTVNLSVTLAQNTGGAGTDLLTGIENVTGGNGADKLTGDANANTLTGDLGRDSLFGGLGNDVLTGGVDNDTIDGGTGVDTASYSTATAGVTVNLGVTLAQNTGGAGTDLLTGIENVSGSNYVDTLIGDANNNLLSSGGGNDSDNGGTGNDTLNGSTGNDTLTGGIGQDVFQLTTTLSATTNLDKITDFVSIDDTVQLENAIFTKLITTGVLNSANFKSGTVAADTNDYIIYNSTTGALYYDADGNGAGAAVQIAVLGITTHPTLATADFVII